MISTDGGRGQRDGGRRDARLSDSNDSRLEVASEMAKSKSSQNLVSKYRQLFDQPLLPTPSSENKSSRSSFNIVLEAAEGDEQPMSIAKRMQLLQEKSALSPTSKSTLNVSSPPPFASPRRLVIPQIAIPLPKQEEPVIAPNSPEHKPRLRQKRGNLEPPKTEGDAMSPTGSSLPHFPLAPPNNSRRPVSMFVTEKQVMSADSQLAAEVQHASGQWKQILLNDSGQCGDAKKHSGKRRQSIDDSACGLESGVSFDQPIDNSCVLNSVTMERTQMNNPRRRPQKLFQVIHDETD